MKKIIDTLDNDTNAGLVIVDRGMVIRYMNARMAQWTGVTAGQALGASLALAFPACAAALQACLLDALPSGPHGRGAVDNGLPAKGLIQIPTPSGAIECMVCFPFTDIDDELSYAALFYDARDAEAFHRSFGSAINRLLRLQVEQQLLLLKLEHKDDHLLEVEKLAGIGQLAAGIAHEINNPIGYIFSNLRTLASYVREMLNLIDAVDTVKSLDEFRQLRNCPEYEYIRSDVESLIRESEEGIDRVKKIIGALKDFSHPEEPGYRPVDLHRCIETTLKVIANEVKYKAEVVKVYGDIPDVECNASQISQVLMNLLVNAAQAIDNFGVITIRTGHEAPWVWLEVDDTGQGMERSVASRIFEPFFTTKAVGQGTGLGLSVSLSILEHHGGSAEVDSEPGRGTRIRLWLPQTQSATAVPLETAG
ncbi:ATP-binding protein [Pollutimonas thiosulfatoxidans]|uniref:histidine kinase n=1 Tax=Pollutimonas thiosulfatoxidans TaxID=2028345 RepID=A0A410GDV9_9BURK|nr:ATP-binding protein [Pollutimonas thiosulfatoxidans]QAA94481.1 hypothetical protein CKA81_12075 [Pollutimonas thiosulfatoxidans]